METSGSDPLNRHGSLPLTYRRRRSGRGSCRQQPPQCARRRSRCLTFKDSKKSVSYARYFPGNKTSIYTDASRSSKRGRIKSRDSQIAYKPAQCGALLYHVYRCRDRVEVYEDKWQQYSTQRQQRRIRTHTVQGRHI